jgi:hypothetical protein
MKFITKKMLKSFEFGQEILFIGCRVVDIFHKVDFEKETVLIRAKHELIPSTISIKHLMNFWQIRGN